MSCRGPCTRPRHRARPPPPWSRNSRPHPCRRPGRRTSRASGPAWGPRRRPGRRLRPAPATRRRGPGRIGPCA
ncbi:hypothetical protein D1J60_03235 [Streptomyces sp. W1SF4]|nr:hypothetical protein D1J60_03235 [Streptomyces sp. W1SF4]